MCVGHADCPQQAADPVYFVDNVDNPHLHWQGMMWTMWTISYQTVHNVHTARGLDARCYLWTTWTIWTAS